MMNDECLDSVISNYEIDPFYGGLGKKRQLFCLCCKMELTLDNTQFTTNADYCDECDTKNTDE